MQQGGDQLDRLHLPRLARPALPPLDKRHVPPALLRAARQPPLHQLAPRVHAPLLGGRQAAVLQRAAAFRCCASRRLLPLRLVPPLLLWSVRRVRLRLLLL